MGQAVGYARVSTKEQNLARQIEALKRYVNEEDIVTDKASGKDLNRPGYISLKEGRGRLKEGDTLYVQSLDRLSRNKEDILKELRYFAERGIRVKVLDLPTTMNDYPTGQEWVLEMINNILIEVMTSFAQAERERIIARQQEGLAAMPVGKNGKRVSTRTGREVGRPRIDYPDNWKEYYDAWQADEITAKYAMDMMGLKCNAFYNLAKRYAEEAIGSSND